MMRGLVVSIPNGCLMIQSCADLFAEAVVSRRAGEAQPTAGTVLTINH